MGVNLKNFLNNNILGNVRTGARDERGLKKFDYFDVHIDNTTSQLAVEIFSEKYNNPKTLKIRFVNQNPIEVFLERYEGVRRRCWGNGIQAKRTDEKGKQSIIACDPEECPYRDEKVCKYVAKLFFLIEGLENEGIWCFPTGSEKGIKKISRRIYRANTLGEDLTEHWYELFLRPEPAKVGINYIPDIRKLEKIEDVSEPAKEQVVTNNEQNNQSQNTNYLQLKRFEKVLIDNKQATKIIFNDTASNERVLFLIAESNQAILNLKPNSIIAPSSISRRETGDILNNYKIIKAA